MSDHQLLTEETLLEAAGSDLSPADFNDDELTIDNVSLTYFESVNKRIYKPSALDDLVALPNDPIWERHPKQGGRDPGDQIGIVLSKRRDGDRNRGKIKFYKDHPKGSLHYRLAKENPRSFAFSHEVSEHKSSKERGTGRLIVERVKKNRGYACVTDGGTNRGIFEERNVEIKTTKDLFEEYPVVAKALADESKKEGSKEASKDLNEEIAKLKVDRDAALAKAADLEEKVGEFEAEKELVSLKKTILESAKSKADKAGKDVDISDDLLESLVKLDEKPRNDLIERCFVERKEGDDEAGPKSKKRRRRPSRFN